MENEYFYFHSLRLSQKHEISTNKNLKTLAKKHLFLKTGDRGASVNTSSFMLLLLLMLLLFFSAKIVPLPPSHQAMEEAFDAILGHRSAHSLATGPVIALPFISPLLLTMTPALSSK